ncbi:MAG: hypothetical protein ABIJ82_01610 [Patescibacteria group bacterium]
MKILIVEDEHKIANAIKGGLEQARLDLEKHLVQKENRSLLSF